MRLCLSIQMDSLMHAVGKVFKANEFNDDDIIDRLNHHFTVLFLVIAMVVVTTTQYVGSPINCWCPAYFTDSHIDFTNKVAASRTLPHTKRENRRLLGRIACKHEGPGFKSQSRRCRVTVLDKLFTPIVPLFTEQQNW